MRAILTPVRFLATILSIFVFLGHMSLVWLVVRDRWKRLRWSNRILRYYCRLGLWVLRVKVTPHGLANLRKAKSGLFVGNHLTYIDVLVISAQVPVAFVTSQEIRETPFLGQICMMAGCLFVERRNKQQLRKEVSELREGLSLGMNVAIFPEATSTNGESILRFRRPLFLSAVDAGRPVIPFCLNYRRVGGEPINVRSRDKIFWYGDMDFAPHLWALSGSGGVEVDLHFLPPMTTHPDMDAGSVAEAAQRKVEAVFLPVREEVR